MPTPNKLAVIGGGAAGFFAAVNAARLNPDLNVTIFEKSRQVLSKVRISGGGRCNVTHHCFDPEIMSKAYPRGSRELRWAFEQFQPTDTVSWFENREVKLKTESDGRMFPTTDDSATIINCLNREADKHNVNVINRYRVEAVKPTNGDQFKLTIRDHENQIFDTVIIATGGSNRRSTYQWLEDLGHSIVEPVPSLFTFNFKEKVFEDLAGISVANGSVSIEGTSYQHDGPILITHWGLSGPAVLKTSAWAARYLYEQNYDFTIRVNWLYPQNSQEVQQKLKELRDTNARKTTQKQDTFPISNRLWNRFLELVDIDPKIRWAELSNENIHHLTEQLTNTSYEIEGKTTYKEEFVTSGGIPLDEVNMGTMESKKIDNLYFAGEVLNIDGITGGYNFQSAWTTGWIAAQHIDRI
ncbi:aminoacetone oxidase family FAD-binding enzyme [Aliifodinibius salipaludis]|uniref:Aminoacetone oxidase family FAD-binding enzyme n=1 Tax=Fodinibius salipaludis TaxID=2032627 RepID=A0A2A2G861_9BACT|nr:NAD(P)/FAD-dependent oxidoreductase [Aliifodinibius salipaludis]PAU93013.1 aminoacetone oxidase family FAD-binding enzyme [Aliifodinibius salipaludis]